MRDCYLEIIGMPHHQSEKRPHMSRHDRAAQFAPFAALVGYEDAVEETARLTDGQIDLDDNYLQELDEKIRRIRREHADSTEVAITYFVPDKLKDGGAYMVKKGRIKKIDGNNREIIMSDGYVVSLDAVLDINLSEEKSVIK